MKRNFPLSCFLLAQKSCQPFGTENQLMLGRYVYKRYERNKKMIYYHIVIETFDKDKNDNFRKIIEYDQTDIELVKKEILFPYLSKNEIFVDGAYLKNNQIRSLKIRKTELNASEITQIANDNLPRNYLGFLAKENVISGDRYTTDITRKLMSQFNNNENTMQNGPKKITSNNKIFIVHGHNNEVKNEMYLFLKKAGLEPIVLHEQASSSKTIIEKIEAFGDVGYAVVLYTPCDIGSENNEKPDLKTRARQNVVF